MIKRVWLWPRDAEDIHSKPQSGQHHQDEYIHRDVVLKAMNTCLDGTEEGSADDILALALELAE